MNISVYLFGCFKNGYSQFPDDYTKTIFAKFYQNAKSTTQVAIHRDGDLMYYGYIRKLEQGNYIGLCSIINGKFLIKTEPLFSIFENIIEIMVKNGYLIHFNNQGEITTSVNRLYENSEELDLIKLSLQNSFEQLEPTAQLLPAVNYGISRDSIQNFTVQDEEKEIIKSTYTNGYTYIYKSKGFNNASLNSYIEILGRNKEEIKKLHKELDSCKSELTKSKLAQKRIKLVAILFGVVFIISLLSMSLYEEKKKLGEDLSNTQIELADTQENLKDANGQLHNKQNELSLVNNRLNASQSKIDDLNNQLNQKDIEIEFITNKYKATQSDLCGARQNISNLKTSIVQKDKKINDLETQIQGLKNTSIAESDIFLQLKNTSNNVLVCSSNNPSWSIEKTKRNNTYRLYIYYKGNYIKQQYITIK